MTTQLSGTNEFWTSIWMDRLKPDLDTVRQAPSTFAAIVVRLRASLAAIAANLRITAEAMTADRAEARQSDLNSLDIATAAAERARDRIQAAIAEVFEESQDTNERIARALERAEAWRRIERRLSGPNDILTVIQEIGAAGDRAGLAVLRGELPSFLAATAPASADTLLRATNTLLDQVEDPLLTPLQRRARRLSAELAKGWPQLMSAAAWCRYEIEGKGTASTIPDWPTAENAKPVLRF